LPCFPRDRIMASPRSLQAGCATLAVAALLALLVHEHPERLHAPAWVAYAAAGSFALAGASLLARGIGRERAAPWFVCLLLAAMTSIPAWIAFGGGPRECAAVLAPVRALLSETLCRGAFGVAAIVLALMFLWAVRDAMRSWRADA
jgi:hypothetical protein